MDLQEAFDAGFDAVKTYVDRSLEAFEARLIAVESRPAVKGEPGEKGADGHSVALEDMEPLVERAVATAVASIPIPKDGIDGRDGKDGAAGADGQGVTLADVEPIIIRAVEASMAAIPAPKHGQDGIHGKDGSPGADGRDGKDGVSVAGALIDRSGALVVTLSDGTTGDLGPVVGKDGQSGQAGRDGKDGIDGLGFDDMTVDHDGERGFVLRFERGDVKKEFTFVIPAVLDRGVWREGQYQKGDGATWAGSFFIAQRDTSDKPETSDAWRLSVKRGRDGKDGKPGDRGPDGAQGKAGRDLTQVGPDGARW